MHDNLEYIDDYFQNQLSQAKREEFESRCLTDKSFAEEVAMYVTARESLKQVLLDVKKKEWAKLVPSEISNHDTTSVDNMGRLREPAVNHTPPGLKVVSLRKGQLVRWLSLGAAACTLTFILIYFMISRNTAHELIDVYVKNELTISNTMDATRDSLQLGITAYNSKNYNEASRIFEALYRRNPENEQILKYIGQAYLMNENYDNALKAFETLSKRTGLRSNAGPFLKAIALMQRNGPRDEEDAKRLLKQVVTSKSEGHLQAEIWLKEME